jgi:hypothetical protein
VTDNSAPIFITAGTLLILLPIIGIVAILVYQRRKRQQALVLEAGEEAQTFLTSNQVPGNTPWTSGPPARYAANYATPVPPQQQPQHAGYPSPQTYMPFFYSDAINRDTATAELVPTPEQAFGGPPAQSPAPPSQPPFTPPPWGPDQSGQGNSGTSPSSAINRGAINRAPTEEDFSEYGEPTIVPFGPFQENLTTQPQKKAPQE